MSHLPFRVLDKCDTDSHYSGFSIAIRTLVLFPSNKLNQFVIRFSGGREGSRWIGIAIATISGLEIFRVDGKSVPNWVIFF